MLTSNDSPNVSGSSSHRASQNLYPGFQNDDDDWDDGDDEPEEDDNLD